MYFAFDPPSSKSIDEIADALQVAAAKSTVPLNTLALVDGAFNERFFADNWRIGSKRISLYERTPLQGLGNASPFLVQGPHDPSALATWLVGVAGACGNAPMWSIIASPCDLDELADHFRPYLIGRTDDTLEWPIRWADTRILPRFIDVLPEDIRSAFLGVVGVWAAISRDGTTCIWRDEGRIGTLEPQFNKLPISEAMFACLVDAAEADAVLAKIDELQPGLLRERRPSDCHRLVTRQLQIADQFKLLHARARQHFSMLAFILCDEFVSELEMRELLVRVSNGADYHAEFLKLSDDFWDSASPKKSHREPFDRMEIQRK